MVQVNKLSSADLWNLNYTFNEVLELYEKGDYPRAFKLAKKGHYMASNCGDIPWIYKFEELLIKTINTCNFARTLMKEVCKKD
jgi:hypothetical protein